MKSRHNHIVLNNENVPVFSPGSTQPVKFGELVDVSQQVENYFDPDTLSKSHQFRVHDLYLPHFSLRSFAAEFKHDAVLINMNDKFTDEIINCFFYDGNLKAFMNSHHEVEMTGGTQLLRYDPQNEIKCWCGGSQPFHAIRFFTSPGYFLDLLPEDERWTDPIRHKIERKEKILQLGNAGISQIQQRILQNILNCPLTGKSAQLLLETSIMQLILLQLHSMRSSLAEEATPKISKKDAELMWSVKNYLSTTFLEDHSLTKLSKTFGTNKFKLNTFFKSMFGVTPFEYIRNERMKAAKEWLKAGESVASVSYRLGYKYPHHFSATFKKVFNVSPSQHAAY